MRSHAVVRIKYRIGDRYVINHGDMRDMVDVMQHLSENMFARDFKSQEIDFVAAPLVAKFILIFTTAIANKCSIEIEALRDPLDRYKHSVGHYLIGDLEAYLGRDDIKSDELGSGTHKLSDGAHITLFELPKHCNNIVYNEREDIYVECPTSYIGVIRADFATAGTAHSHLVHHFAKDSFNAGPIRCPLTMNGLFAVAGQYFIHTKGDK
jgi:hypothetical protein